MLKADRLCSQGIGLTLSWREFAMANGVLLCLRVVPFAEGTLWARYPEFPIGGRATSIQNSAQLDSITARSQRNKAFCNTFEVKAALRRISSEDRV